MKFTAVFASLAAFIPVTIAIDPRFPATGPFKMMVLAYESPTIHYSYIQVNDGYLTIGLTSNSSCGTTEPIFDGGSGTISLYSNESSTNQQVFVDISGAAGGLMSYTGPLWNNIPQSSIYNNFSRVSGADITELYNENKTWIACPSEKYTYLVYSSADYSHEIRTNCIDFEIRTDGVADPQSCTYF